MPWSVDVDSVFSQNEGMGTSNDQSQSASGSDRFRTTSWSMVLAARDKPVGTDSTDWHESLESLCGTYWYPLYAFLRRKGYSPDDSQDLTQDFFATLIEKDFLKAIDPERGRFRWFMMDAIKKFAASWNAAQSAQKRGGDRKILSLEFEKGENRYQREPVDGWTAEKLFDRRWALALLDNAMSTLQEQYRATGKQRHFEALKIFLTPDSSPPAYADVAQELDLSLTAVKVAIHRLRDKYREVVLQQVADTLDNNELLEDEFDRLLNSI